MNSFKAASFILLTTCALILSACEKSGNANSAGSSSGSTSGAAGGATSVGVVDLDQVAKALNWDKAITNSVQNFNTQLNAQLAAAQKEYQTQVDAKKQQIGEKPTPQQQKELEQMVLTARQRLTQGVQEVRQRTVDAQNQAVGKFRDEVKRIAKEVAKERKLSAVVVNDAGILFWDETLDVTDAVIALMRARNLVAQVPPVQTPAQPAPTVDDPAPGNTPKP